MKRTLRLPSLVLTFAICFCASAKGGAYLIDRNVSIPTGDGATICALILRPAGALRLPAALEFTIYHAG
jgi:hypothetical protein